MTCTFAAQISDASSPARRMRDFSGHERFTTASTEFRDGGWLNRAWQSTCECGWKSDNYNHPIDAGFAATAHAIAESTIKEAIRV